MTILTDREAEEIIKFVREIRLEVRRPASRKNRVQNLAGKVSVIISKAKRRKHIRHEQKES